MAAQRSSRDPSGLLESAVAQLVKPEHMRLARMLSYALALSPYEGLRAFEVLSRVFRECLTPLHRQNVAWAALKACDPAEAQMIAEDLFESDVQLFMMPALDPSDLPDNAQWWAASLSREELLAYGLAIMDLLTSRERAGLIGAAKRNSSR